MINVGAEGTAYSAAKIERTKAGGDPASMDAEGHGFIGVGQPTACGQNGRSFVLSDVLGVDEEKGFTMSEDKHNVTKKSRFITEDVEGEIDYGERTKNIYA